MLFFMGFAGKYPAEAAGGKRYKAVKVIMNNNCDNRNNSNRKKGKGKR